MVWQGSTWKVGVVGRVVLAYEPDSCQDQVVLFSQPTKLHIFIDLQEFFALLSVVSISVRFVCLLLIFSSPNELA